MYCPNPDCPDLIEGGVRGEYVDGITQCPRCGITLVEGVAADSAEALRVVDGDVDVESVFVTADGTEAAVVRSLLESSGIPFTVGGTADQAYLGLGWAGIGVVGRGGVSFTVRSEDAAAVRELLEHRELVEDEEV
ncbi:MAG: hypothetical protein KAJ78_02770 [Acidobacteria bacterium]|nr:hypothetical protein [Acidobacteriota bacterium]